MEKNVKEMSLSELRDELSRLEALPVYEAFENESRFEDVANELYDRADAQEKDAL